MAKTISSLKTFAGIHFVKDQRWKEFQPIVMLPTVFLGVIF